MQNLILLLFHTIFSKFQSFIDKRSVCVTDNKRSLLESFICLGCVTSKVSTGRRRHINQKHLFVAKTIKKAVAAVELSSFPNEARKLTEGKKSLKLIYSFALCNLLTSTALS